MRIKQILNNNAVIGIDNNENEFIATGKGIGFKKVVGEVIEENIIDKKIWKQIDNSVDQLVKLLSEISDQYILVVNKILEIAKNDLKIDFNNSLYFNLATHLQFAVERYFKKIPFNHPLKEQISHFYPKEYSVGIKSVEVLNKEFEIKMSEDEAAYITNYLIDAELEHDTSKVILMVTLIEKILKMTSTTFGIKSNYTEEYFLKFIAHLRWYLQKEIYTVKQPKLEDGNFNDFYEILSKENDEVIVLISKIKRLLYKELNVNVSRDDETFLLLHLTKIFRYIK